MTKTFERTYHQELQRLQECDNLSDIIDCIQDLDAALESLAGIETWAKEAKKDIGHLTKTFERTFQRELHNWQEYDDISGIADSLVDLGSTIDSLTFYVNDARDNQKEE